MTRPPRAGSRRAGRSSALAPARRQGSTPGRWPRPIPCTSAACGCRSVPGARHVLLEKRVIRPVGPGRPRSPRLPPSPAPASGGIAGTSPFPVRRPPCQRRQERGNPRRASGPWRVGSSRNPVALRGRRADHRDRVLIQVFLLDEMLAPAIAASCSTAVTRSRSRTGLTCGQSPTRSYSRGRAREQRWLLTENVKDFRPITLRALPWAARRVAGCCSPAAGHSPDPGRIPAR